LSELRFYIDENVEPEVAEQLKHHGIEAVSAKSLGKLGDSDPDHLQRARAMGYVLCTHDQDLLRLNAEGVEHAGIAFESHYGHSIGGWVRALRDLHTKETAESMVNQVKFLNVK
jgi:hypothetical protein